MWEGPDSADPGEVEVMIDGHAQLRAAADAAAQQRSLEDVWAGRAPSQKVTKACGLCGHFQNITVPFLRRTCTHCSATWMPARCDTCGSTVIAAVREDDALFHGTCICGGELVGLAAIPRQRIPRTRADVVAELALQRAKGRYWRYQTQLLGVAVVLLSVLGMIYLLRAESGAGNAPAPSTADNAVHHRSADPASSAGRGAAAADRIRASGGEINVFACQEAYLAEVNAATQAARAAAPSATPVPTGASAAPPGTATGTNLGTTGSTPSAGAGPPTTDRAYLAACLTG
ncbi:MAG TPA: hypothetical protein VHE83_19105 [Mycobacteriales bacterium]|nr:hypothetical protein [Mycobacteriales bacterium]